MLENPFGGPRSGFIPATMSLIARVGSAIRWPGLALHRAMATAVQQKPVSSADNRFARLEAREMAEDSVRTGVLAFKRGMMSHFDKWGYRHPVTVLDV